MSKHILRHEAQINSGITYEQSIKITSLNPSMYHRIGKEEGCLKLSTLFYDRVFNDKEEGTKWFLNIFSSSTRNEAIDNQV